MDVTRGVECVWTNPGQHPCCPHGPALLFNKYENGETQKFFACSACRDRTLCKFYVEYGKSLSKPEKLKWDKLIHAFRSQYPDKKLFLRFNDILAQKSENRHYCHECERLITTAEKLKHENHSLTEELTDQQINNPTTVLKPKENVKQEAQYLFSKKSVEDIANMLLKLNAKQVLCIGTPRIHEYISTNLENKMSSLLLDFDGRFHNFFGPLNFCWYNLFNHHFFNDGAAEVFKEFMTQGKDIYLIFDPPFGGRVEPMSWTIKKITDLHKKWNNIQREEDTLKIMFIFPYFMESIMKQKSNPPGISGGLKDLKMTDYKVDYDNHPLFTTSPKGNKQSSPVRIFTNIPLNLLELPEADGYRYCKRCERWIASENKHCKKCKECTSKDGKRYRHCKVCERCVKPTWKHCIKCNRCSQENHICGSKPKITGQCFACGKLGHTEKDCSKGKNQISITEKKIKKRKEITDKEMDVNSTSKKLKLAIAKPKIKRLKSKKTSLTTQKK